MQILIKMPFAIRKLHRSLYRCTASGNPSVQFANSMPFFCTLVVQTREPHHSPYTNMLYAVLRLRITPAGSVCPFWAIFSTPEMEEDFFALDNAL